MKRRTVLILTGILVLSVTLLALAHYGGDPSWIRHHLSVAHGSDGILWQVQTTFLSVGFAGLAIAVQLFAEAPLAIGASRGQVLEHIKAGWFVGVGLVANAIIAVETMWLPSGLGVLGVALVGFTPTVVMLVVSTTRLMQLFGNPSRLDQVVRTSLVGTISERLRDVSSKYADAKGQLERLSGAELSVGVLEASSHPLRVPVPEAGRIIRMIRPDVVRKAIEPLRMRATERNSNGHESAEPLEPFQVRIYAEPGDRTRLGDPAFEVVTSRQFDEATKSRMVRRLQSSIVFEPAGSVTPYEEIDREIAHLQDAIGTNLRSGALATAERALVLLGDVVRGVWMTKPAMLGSTWRASLTRRDWLLRSVGEAEQDALLSPRVAGMFVGAAMTRALEAPRTGSTEYVDECLRSFTRLWFDVLRHGGAEFDSVPSRITTCVQNLATYSYSVVDEREDLEARGTWAMVELVKLALDARRPDAAKLAAQELSGLFKFDREGTRRSHVRGGQLVLSGWLDYLAAKNDERDPADAGLRAKVTPRGTWAEIISARHLTERGAVPFGRWDWWETTVSAEAQLLELSSYIDRAEVAALSISYGSLPPADTPEASSEYKRLLEVIGASAEEVTPAMKHLEASFAAEIARWDTAEGQLLAQEPLSPTRVEDVGIAIRATLAERPRLADEIVVTEDDSGAIDDSHPILGMNFRVPREFLVDKVFNNTYADPTELGRIIGRGFVDGEDQKILGTLRTLQANALPATGVSIRNEIEALGAEAEHYVLVAPYGGLDDIHAWYSEEFRGALGRVTQVESGVLDNEAILFDRRDTVRSNRRPEEKAGLEPVQGTSIALGVFEDVEGGDEPQVRLETGEYLVVWPGQNPRVVRFGGEQALESSNSPEPAGTDL